MSGLNDADLGPFDRGLYALAGFVATHGHARVPARYVNEQGLALGHWSQWQRQRAHRGTLTDNERLVLSTYGFSFDGRRARLDDALAAAEQWAEDNGDLTRLTADVVDLGVRVRETLLSARRSGRLTSGELRWLEQNGFEVASGDGHWARQMGQLEQFLHEHHRAPLRRLGDPIARWRYRQLAALAAGRLTETQRVRFQALEHELAGLAKGAVTR